MKLWPFKREQRSIDKMALWGRGAAIDLDTWAGIPVSRDTATRIVAVYACVSLRAETVAELPADVYRRVGDERVLVNPAPLWLRQPNDETNWFEFVERVNTSLDLDGNAYIAITMRDRLGFPAELFTLHPDEVEVRRDSSGVFYIWGGSERMTRYTPLNPLGDVLHIRNLSWGSDKAPSPIGVARNALSLAMAAEKQGARFFGSGQQLSGVIELPPAEGRKSDEFVQKMREYWEEQHGGPDKSHRPAVLTGGAKWTPITMTNEDAQFLETRKFQVCEIARLFRIPPHMIGDVEKSTSWGTGIEQQQIGFVQYSINPRLARLEAAFNQLLPRGQFIKWNVNGLLRGDSASRAAFYKSGIEAGWFLRSEARQLEDLPEVDGLDEPVLPANITPANEPPPESPIVAADGDST